MRDAAAGQHSPVRRGPTAVGVGEAAPVVAEAAGAAVRRSRWRFALGAAVGVGASVAVVQAAGGLAEAFGALERLDASWLLVAVVAVLVRVAAYSTQIRLLDRGRFPAAAGVALTLYGLGAVTPAAPAEGLVLAERELRRRGRSREHAVLVLGFSEWFAQRTFYVVAIAALLGALAFGQVTLAETWPLLVVAALIAAVLVATAALAMRPGRARRSAAAVARVLRAARRRAVDTEVVQAWHQQALAFVGPAPRRILLAAVSATGVLADGAVLWGAGRAADLDVPYVVALLCAVGATVVTWVPLLPAGLGLVEAALPALLHRFEAPLDAALAASLAYRAAGTVLPALLGAVAVLVLGTAQATGLRSGRDR